MDGLIALDGMGNVSHDRWMSSWDCFLIYFSFLCFALTSARRLVYIYLTSDNRNAPLIYISPVLLLTLRGLNIAITNLGGDLNFSPMKTTFIWQSYLSAELGELLVIA
jgi:hypothetical protein